MAAAEGSCTNVDLDSKGKAMEEQDEEIYDVEPISWAFPVGYNENINDDNALVIISPVNEVVSPSTRSKGKQKCPETPEPLLKNWEIFEKLQSSGTKNDKNFYHREKEFTLRSRKAAEYYEMTRKFLEKNSKTNGNEI